MFSFTVFSQLGGFFHCFPGDLHPNLGTEKEFASDGFRTALLETRFHDDQQTHPDATCELATPPPSRTP